MPFTLDDKINELTSQLKSRVRWIVKTIERTVGLSNPTISYGSSTVNKGVHKKIYSRLNATAQKRLADALSIQPLLAKKKIPVVTVSYAEFDLIGIPTFRPEPRWSQLGIDSGNYFTMKVGRKFHSLNDFSATYIEESVKKALPSLNEEANNHAVLKSIRAIKGVRSVEDNGDGSYHLMWKDSRRGGDFDEYRDRYRYDYGYDEDQASERAHDEYYESIESQKQGLLTAIKGKGAIVVDYDVSLYRSIDITFKIKGAKMSNLRNKIIRLAHQKPELREHLLPLLKQGNDG